MDTNSLSFKTLRNSAYFFTGYVLPILVGIVVTPYVIHRLGVAEFGIVILVGTIMSFLGYLDLGLGLALTKYAAEYKAQGNISGFAVLLGSVRSLVYINGVLGLLIFLAIGQWLLPVFHIPEQSRGHMFIVFLLGGLTFLFNSMNSAAVGVVTATQRFDLITKINIANLVLTNILTVLAVYAGYQVKAIMAINLLISIFVFVLYNILERKLFNNEVLNFNWDWAEIKKAYRFGILSFITSLSAGALVFLDRLIIPIFINPTFLSYYSLPGNVALKTTGITNSLSAMLFPMASALQGAGENERMQQIYARAFRNLSIIAAGITTGIILFSRHILTFWLGSDFADRGTGILVILALTNYLVSLYIPLQSMLMGLGELKFLVKQSVVMALLNLVLLLFFVPKMGIIGAAWAYLAAILPVVYAFYWVEKKLFKLTERASYYTKFYFGLLVTALAVAAVVKFAVLPFVNSVYLLVFAGPLTVLLYYLAYYLFGFMDQSDVEIFKSFIFKVIRLKFK